MKTKYIIALFLVGIIVLIVGSMFKIMHWPYSNKLIMTATAIKVIAAVLAIIKVLTGKNNFLNS